MQRPLPRAGRARQARRVGSGRRAVRISGDVAGRDERSPDGDALPQPRVDGCRGVDSRQSDRRRRPPLRLRQDHAIADHGGRELRSAGAGGVRRTDAQRQVPRRRYRVGHRRLALQRRSPRRHDEPERIHAGRVLHVALVGHVQRHGHGLDDGVDGGVAWADAAGERRHSCGRLAPLCAGAPRRPAHRRAGERRRAHFADPDAGGLRECDSRERRDRRIDQCGAALARDCRTRWRAGHAAGLGRSRARRTDHRRSDAVGPIPDGGLLLRGRSSRRHPYARRERDAQSRRVDGQRPDDLGELPRSAELTTRK